MDHDESSQHETGMASIGNKLGTTGSASLGQVESALEDGASSGAGGEKVQALEAEAEDSAGRGEAEAEVAQGGGEVEVEVSEEEGEAGASDSREDVAEPSLESSPQDDDDDDMLPLGEFIAKATGQIDEMRLVGGTLTGAAVSATQGNNGNLAGISTSPSVTRPSAPLKDRFNYLSLNAGAKVLAAAPEMQNAYQILNDDKDSYAMAERDVNRKWITVSLSQEIHLDTIVLANFELYSCHVRRFQILGSQTYPCQQWALLGEFDANETRSDQPFHLPQPMFVRFLKFRFLTHHGRNHYWALSTIRAYGQTDIDKFHSAAAQLKEAKQKVLAAEFGEAEESPDVEKNANMSKDNESVEENLVDAGDDESLATGNTESKDLVGESLSVAHVDIANVTSEKNISVALDAAVSEYADTETIDIAINESDFAINAEAEKATTALTSNNEEPIGNSSSDLKEITSQFELAVNNSPSLPDSSQSKQSRTSEYVSPYVAESDSNPPSSSQWISSMSQSVPDESPPEGAAPPIQDGESNLPTSRTSSDIDHQSQPTANVGDNGSRTSSSSVSRSTSERVEASSADRAGLQATTFSTTPAMKDEETIANDELRPTEEAPSGDPLERSNNLSGWKSAVNHSHSNSGQTDMTSTGEANETATNVNTSLSSQILENNASNTSTKVLATEPTTTEAISGSVLVMGKIMLNAPPPAPPSLWKSTELPPLPSLLMTQPPNSEPKLVAPAPSPPIPFVASPISLPPTLPEDSLAPSSPQRPDTVDVATSLILTKQPWPLPPSPPALVMTATMHNQSQSSFNVSVDSIFNKTNANATEVSSTPIAPAPKSSDVDAFLARNDPNSIFNTLQAKVIALELNNSLILDWLTLWKTQISAKIRVLNTTLNETTLQLRSSAAEVANLRTEMEALTSENNKLRTFLEDRGFEMDSQSSSGRNLAEVDELVSRLMHSQSQIDGRVAEELASFRLARRIELACTLLISLGLSCLIFFFCLPAYPVVDYQAGQISASVSDVPLRRSSFSPLKDLRRSFSSLASPLAKFVSSRSSEDGNQSNLGWDGDGSRFGHRVLGAAAAGAPNAVKTLKNGAIGLTRSFSSFTFAKSQTSVDSFPSTSQKLDAEIGGSSSDEDDAEALEFRLPSPIAPSKPDEPKNLHFSNPASQRNSQDQGEYAILDAKPRLEAVGSGINIYQSRAMDSSKHADEFRSGLPRESADFQRIPMVDRHQLLQDEMVK